MFFLSCTYILHAKESAHICKENYENGELYVDCSNMRLNFIPQLPSNTFSLNLQHNRVYDLLGYGLNVNYMKNLTVLDLSFNNLEHIRDGWFNGLKKLQQLRLNNNKLKYDTESFPI